jgi:tetratricopeptide (TPR) repeat protein
MVDTHGPSEPTAASVETFVAVPEDLGASHLVESTSPDNLQHTKAGDEDEVDRRHYAPFALQSGAQIGRYVVLNQVGAGAMGVVYAAYDPELDRKLALKLMRPRSGSSEKQSAGRTRLLREAQALAKLRHPNVVAVHDVGTYEGRVYIAMEFVEGETLGAWIGRRKPSLHEILRVFQDAGRGLAAAHRADLIHRDFKPDNVLIAKDGSVRVLDFGLARATGEQANTQRLEAIEASGGSEDGLSGSLSSSLGSSNALSADLTRTGGIMGTPAYMSPEQHLGLEATAASDQFSFAVALYEALYGERPFGGNTVAAVAFAVTQGKVRDAPSTADVPFWLRRIVLGALHSEPKDRYPSMDALLDALGRDPSRTVKRVLGLAIVLGLVGALAWKSGAQQVAPVDPCAGATSAIEGVWGPAKAKALQAHFADSDLAFAELRAKKVSEDLDAWRDAWASSAIQNCRETRVEASQSESLFDRRVMCLSRALGKTQALVDRLSSASDAAIERAAEAVTDLPSLEPCSDKERLMAVGKVLEGEAKVEADALAKHFDEVEAMIGTGDYKEAQEHLRKTDERAESVDDPMTVLRHAEIDAKLQNFAEADDEAIGSLKRAYLAADRGGDDWSRASLAIKLMETYGQGLARAEPAAEWEAMAEAAIERIGSPARAQAALTSARGTVLTRQAKYDEAIEVLTKSVALSREVGLDELRLVSTRQRLAVALRAKGRVDEAEAIQRELLEGLIAEVGPKHPRTAVIYGSLGNSLFSRAKYAEAAEHYERALKIIEESYSKESPRYYDRLNNYAAALMSMGKAEEAEQIHRSILRYNTERFGAEDIRLAPSFENIGNTLTGQGRFEEAKASYERALAIKIARLGEDHPSVATSKMNLGTTLFQMGDYVGAEKLHKETLEVWMERLGPEHVDLGLVYTNLGDVHEATGRYRSAAKYQADAIRLFAKAWGEDNVDIAWPTTGLGLARLGMGDVNGAIEAFERARQLRESPDAALPEGERARMDFGYARALDKAGREADAIEVAQACLADAKAGDEKLAKKIEAWLAER